MTRSTPSSPAGSSKGEPNGQLYTTAGTVYNPAAVTPLQPPTRKGRASKWPPPSQCEFGMFNKSFPSGYPHMDSPLTTASSLKHYSPLQQNSARAVDPSTVPNPLNRSASGPPSSALLAASNPRTIVTSLDKSNCQSRNMDLKYEGKGEDKLASLSKFGAKGLTSLASYPNTYQQMARRALDKARETVKASEPSRPKSPTFFRQGNQRQHGAGALQSSTNFGQDYGDNHGRFSRTSHVVGSTRSSVLSSGPGAPRPLTAGPPGQRQYKAAIPAGTSRALQGDTRQPSFTVNEARFASNPSALVTLGRPTTTKTSLRQTPDQHQYGVVTLEDILRARQDDTKQPSSMVYETRFASNPSALVTLGRPTTAMTSLRQTPDQHQYGVVTLEDILRARQDDTKQPSSMVYEARLDINVTLGRPTTAKTSPRPQTPDQHQYGVVTLEDILRARQDDTKQPSSKSDEAPHVDSSALVTQGRSMTTKTSVRPQTPCQPEQPPTRPSSVLGSKPLYDAFASVPNASARPPDPARRPGRTRDTLPVESLRQYFPNGFPSDYHYKPNPAIRILPQGADLELQEGRYIPTSEEMELRDARSRVAFYSSDRELLETLDEKIADARNRLRKMKRGLQVPSGHVAAPGAVNICALPEVDMPDHEVDMPDHEVDMPDHEDGTPDHEVDMPDHEVSTPDHEVGTPDHEVDMPDHEVGTPDHEVSPPDNEVDMPDHEVGTPDNEVDMPDHEDGTPDHEVDMPDHEVSTPDHEVDMPDHEVSTPDHEVSPPDNEVDMPDHEFTTELADEMPTHEAATSPIDTGISTVLIYWGDDDLSMPANTPTGSEDTEDYELWPRDQGKDGKIGQSQQPLE